MARVWQLKFVKIGEEGICIYKDTLKPIRNR
jgi:hypothetical protein